MSDAIIDGVVNPLAFLEVDEPWASMEHKEVTTEHVLSFLCNPREPCEIAEFVARYRKVSVEDPRLFFAPAEARLLTRLIWPLRQAKGSFMLGHYLATVSLCGMVAEMSSILTFNTSRISVNGHQLGAQEQSLMFGAVFEKQGQERRVAILEVYGLIGAETRQCYDRVRLARRKYLHHWSASHQDLERDAIDCFTASVKIVVATLGLGVNQGHLTMKQEVLDYLMQHREKPDSERDAGV